MIVSELYSGSGLGNQLWNLVVPRIVAERHGYEWGVKKSNPFKACAFMTNFDFGREVIGGTGPEGGPPDSLPEGIVNYYKERDERYPSYMGGEEVMFFDEYLWNNLPDNTKIDGCFQKMGYITDRRDDIIKWLDYDNKITDYSSDDICVIQFRGGDYLTGASWLPPEYYQNAAKHMLGFVLLMTQKMLKSLFLLLRWLGLLLWKKKTHIREALGGISILVVLLELIIQFLILLRMRLFLHLLLRFGLFGQIRIAM